MTASIWNPGQSGAIPIANADNTYKSQYFVATKGQSVFALTAFAYALGTDSLDVAINGVTQIYPKDFEETSGTSITLLDSNLQSGDIVYIRGLVGGEGSQSAASSAAQAAISATIAQSAATAVLDKTNVFIGTSATENTVGLGNKSFDVGASKQFQTGQFVMASRITNNGIYMVGQVISYIGSIVTISVSKFEGAGIYNNWNVSVTGIPQPVPATPSIFATPSLLAQVESIVLAFS